jgi:ABC-type dipeptide/oligopeptide/nickel transport system permease subunit
MNAYDEYVKQARRRRLLALAITAALVVLFVALAVVLASLVIGVLTGLTPRG